MERVRIAYLAGVLDVLGKIRTMTTEGETELPYLAVSSPNRDLLKDLAQISGTRPFTTTRTYDRHRCTEHCVEAHTHIVSTSARWSVTGVRATVMLAACEPYMPLQGTLVRNVLSIGLVAPRKAATVAKMKDLGWPLPKEWR